MVIRRWTCHQLAPSIWAASTTSAGMPWSPARNSSTARPRYFQVSTTSTVQSAKSGVPSQPCSGPCEADGGEQRVDHAVLRLQQLQPDDAGDHLGEHVGDEDDRAQQPLSRASCG